MMSIHRKTFIAAIKQYLNTEFVQTASAQIEVGNHVQESATLCSQWLHKLFSQQLDKCLKYWN